MITREDRIQQAHEAMETVARLMRSLAAHGQVEKIDNLLVDALPWVRFLPEKDCAAFEREFMWTLNARNDLDVWAPFGRMLHEWQRTAAIHADPALAKELSCALDADLGPALAPLQGAGGVEE